jgi:hypothetical protein
MWFSGLQGKAQLKVNCRLFTETGAQKPVILSLTKQLDVMQ